MTNIIAVSGTKGGAGCSTFAAALALSSTNQRATLIDTQGDLPSLLGMTANGVGVGELLKTDEFDPGIFGNLAHKVTDNVGLISRGNIALKDNISKLAVARLLEALGSEDGIVIIDVGVPTSRWQRLLCEEELAMHVIVTRSCYLALRRAVHSNVSASGVIAFEETGRSLRLCDVSDVLGMSVIASVPVTASIARTIDAGIFATRRPQTLTDAATTVLERILNVR